MPAGAPSKYDPKHCETVIAVGEAGGNLDEMAEACDVVRATLLNWKEVHPEFLTALTRAEQKSRVFMERLGRAGITADKFNQGQWKNMMSSRYEEYREKRDLSVSGQLAVEHVKRSIVKAD